MESTARWTSRPRPSVTAWLLAGVVAALALPAGAQAHGAVDPAASSYQARVGQVPEGTDATVVDGDLRLWMRAAPARPCLTGAPVTRAAAAGAAVATTVALALAGCGGASPPREPLQRIPAALARESRPIGRGPRFVPAARGPVLGACHRRLGPRDAVHVELFATDRVVLVATGIGTRPPRRRSAGRITGARCYGALVTLEPTGVVLVRRGSSLMIADLFTAWGQPLGAHRMASFRARAITAFVDGRRHGGSVASIRLRRHAEIVLEVGPHVPPHSAYRFPPGD